MHRMVIDAQHNQRVGHMNGNGLDNRKSNLRICTNAQSRMNAQKRTKGTSKYKGASWHKLEQRWISKIKMNGETIHLGYFKNEQEAAIAYDNAALKYFGEFARLNFQTEKAEIKKLVKEKRNK